MTKNEMKDLMFDVLNDHGLLFKDVTLSDALDALIINPIDDENIFIIKVDYLKDREDVIRLCARKNPAFLSMGLAIMQLCDLEIIDENIAKDYMAEIAKHADKLEKQYNEAQE